MGNEIAEDVGRLFEVGFNIGILTYIQQHEEDFSHHLENLYVDDLRKLRFPMLEKSILKRAHIISEWNRQVARKWLMFFLQKGFLAGVNFFHEYLQSLNIQGHKLEIVYYQCSFCGSNSANTNYKPEEQEWQEVLAQLAHRGLDVNTIDTGLYSRQGRFLRADTLMLLHYASRWRVLCVDLSAFAVKSPANLKDPNNIEMLRRLLLHELGYRRSKSVFSNLSIDTDSGSLDATFSKGLDRYFTAFKRDDKESVKLIQAASYAYDFYGFLKARGVLGDEDMVIFNVVGHTDRSINAMSVNSEHMKVLETCASIYQRHTSPREIQEERMRVLETIRANAAKSFEQGETFSKNLIAIAEAGDGVQWVPSHRECIDDFVSSIDPLPVERIKPELVSRLGAGARRGMSLRDAHGELIKQELAGAKTYLFLTGNPGIGKTTAIVKFLQEHAAEGFLFFYVSPRKQVNLDIIDKFREVGTSVFAGNVFALTSNSKIIHDNQGKPTVHYYSSKQHGNFSRQGTSTRINFIDAATVESESQRGHSHRLELIQEDLAVARDENVSGVLDSICNALYVNMKEPISNNIIATIAIQSLKKTADGRDTLKHLHKIFQGAYNSKEDKVIPEQIREIAGRFKHLFIMIDEVTGDESGVEFLAGINKFIGQYGLTKPEYGFNLKVIVADASIVDAQVIRQHLTQTAYEPDKIYFRHVPKGTNSEPLSLEEFEFKRQAAVAINANSYPARRLHINYNVCVEPLKFDEETFLETKDRLADHAQKKMMEDILTILERPGAAQAIVYIQDKRRLVRLTREIKKILGAFEKNQDYIEIHANISEADKENMRDCRDKVRVIFMTASASRGLSFPRVKYILVDIPHFEIEQNLMEIIQVIYRGRGEFKEEGVFKTYDGDEKELSFYLSDRTVYYDDDSGDRRLSLQESALNLLNILLILKTSIKTRMCGYGQVGFERFMMIPIGGKSVLAAGESFTGVMEKLIRELRKEYYRRPEDKWLEEIYTTLQQLLGRANFRLTEQKVVPGATSQRPGTSYLSMRTTFSTTFANAAYDGFDRLLAWQPIEAGYISGDLLIVPFAEKSLQEHYLIQLEHGLAGDKGENDLLRKMYFIRKSRDYPESLHTAMKDAIDLVQMLDRAPADKTQRFMQNSRHPDQYYALPLTAFMFGDVMKDSFARGEAEQEEYTFRDVLSDYVRTLYPVNNTLPIGGAYSEFPFVVFRSFNLREVRNKLFTGSNLFISHELNVLNMLLSYKG